MDKEYKVTRDSLITKAGWSPFEGTSLKGTPIMTMIRGKIVVEEREISCKKNFGKFTPRLESSII
jgi:dihydroorotase